MPNIDELLGGARDAITVKRVYGDPIEIEGMTVVPAAKIFGGGGGGGDSDNNGGLGFGVGAKPVGAYVIADGKVTWRPAIDVNQLVGLAFLLGLVFALKAPTRRRRP